MASGDLSARGLSRRIKRHVHAGAHEFYAVVQPGFEETARDELAAIGISGPMEITEGGISFSAHLEECYRVNLCARTVTRLLMRIARFRAENFTSLKEKAAAVPWELHLGGGPPGFSITCRKSRLRHTGAIEERLRETIVRRLAANGAGVDTTRGEAAATQTLYVRFDHDFCKISLDSSGEALYRRGYKTHVTEAPLRETTAAAILRAARLHEYDTLLDPMGGSGTFSLEGAMMFQGTLPEPGRSFAFQGWPAFRAAAFNHLVKKLCKEHNASTAAGKTVIYRDIDPAALEAAVSNIDAAGMAGVIRAERGDFLAGPLLLPPGRTLIVLNPPWGTRLGDPGKTRRLYRRIGDAMKKYYDGCGYAVIVPGLEMEKVLGLSYDRKLLFMSGGKRVGVLIKDGVKSSHT